MDFGPPLPFFVNPLAWSALPRLYEIRILAPHWARFRGPSRFRDTPPSGALAHPTCGLRGNLSILLGSCVSSERATPDSHGRFCETPAATVKDARSFL